MTLNHASTIAEMLKSVTSAIAIIVGGIWTYQRFIRGREVFPRVGITHEVSSIGVVGDKQLLRVVSIIENKGQVLVCIKSTTTRIKQVWPFPYALEEGPEAEAVTHTWPTLAEQKHKDSLEIEPGETDTVIANLFVDSSVNLVEVFTWVENLSKTKEGLGWRKITLLPLERAAVDGARRPSNRFVLTDALQQRMFTAPVIMQQVKLEPAVRLPRPQLPKRSLKDRGDGDQADQAID